MSLLEAILLGTLQGATEFLPVSSSGHLKLGAAALGIAEPDLLFDIILHVGSLVAVCVVFWRSLLEVILGLRAALAALLGGKGISGMLESPGARLSVLIVAATVPTALVALPIKGLLEGPWLGTGAVGGLLILNGFILLFSKKADALGARRQADAPPDEPPPGARSGPLARLRLWRMGLPGALLVGVAQGVAALPGLSRSGSTITAALLLGVEREQAARFSFLLSIPAILGALVVKFDPALLSNPDPARLTNYGVGALTAGLVGAVCLLLLMRLLRQARFHHFAWYCFAVGAAAIVWTLNA